MSSKNSKTVTIKMNKKVFWIVVTVIGAVIAFNTSSITIWNGIGVIIFLVGGWFTAKNWKD